MAAGVPARYYDGRTAVAWPAILRVEGFALRIDRQDGTPLARWPLSGIEAAGDWSVSGPLTLRSVMEADARLVLPDAAAVEQLKRLAPSLATLGEDRRWRPRRMATVGAAVIAALALIMILIDRAPEWVGPRVPPSWLAPVGDALLAQLTEDEPLCSRGEGTEALETLARRLAIAAGYERPIRVEVVDSTTVNALALPGDRIVLLQGLILRTQPHELAAVLAHEVGHVVHAHVTRALMRYLGLSTVAMVLGGSDLAGAVASSGGALLLLSYGRETEAEADRAAVEMLSRLGLKASGLGTFLARTAGSRAADPSFTWLSTHPSDADRIASTPAEDAGAEPFTPEEWRAILATCAPGS